MASTTHLNCGINGLDHTLNIPEFINGRHINRTIITIIINHIVNNSQRKTF